jgi:hypothetical protein
MDGDDRRNVEARRIISAVQPANPVLDAFKSRDAGWYSKSPSSAASAIALRVEVGPEKRRLPRLA